MEYQANTVKPKKQTNIIIKFFIGFFAILGFIASVLFVFLFLFVFAISSPVSVPNRIILEVNMTGGFPEYVSEEPVSRAVFGHPFTLRDFVDSIDRAAYDSRVTGLVARIGGQIGLGQIQEIRNAIERFRRTGRPAIAYAESFGELQSGNGAYYLATAFDEIYLQPTGMLGLMGLSSEMMFMKGAMDKLGVVAKGGRREEYKNAYNQYTEKEYTRHHLESTRSILDSQFDQIINGIAEARNISGDDLRNSIDEGPFFAEEALEMELVDKLGYRDEAIERIRDISGGRAKTFSIRTYLQGAGRRNDKGDEIALIYANGTIMSGGSGYDPILSGEIVGSSTIARALSDAVEKNVSAIILRINSPGGSHSASDVIRREIVRAKENGIPVIASMGDVAASGGYYIAADADRIIAQPGTLTGSIGVYGFKLVTKDLWEKLGITWDSYKTSKNADAFSFIQDFTPEQLEKFQSGLDRVYEDFTGKVAGGRNIPIERVLEIAKGRVYTGDKALELGLVDAIGGFPEAIAMAKEAAGIPDDAPVDIKLFPRERSTFELLFESGYIKTGKENNTALNKMLTAIKPITGLLSELSLNPYQNILRAPGLENIRH
ncbi:MAG: signal peptide peptidase SppA [bacterium]|nr:signal peptide peptidase SppA [bacterium]